MKYLFLLLIPIGLFVFVVSIRKVIGLAATKMIYEMSFVDRAGSFILDSSGKYDIWLCGKKFMRSPAYKFGIKLKNYETGAEAPIYASILRTTVNGFNDARVKLYTFNAVKGRYNIILSDKVEAIENIISAKAVDCSKFSIQIRENMPTLFLFLSVWGIILGFMTAMAGIIIPIAV